MNYSELIKDFLKLFSNGDVPYQIITDKQEIKYWQTEQKKYKRIGLVYSDPYILLLRDLVEFPDGHRGGYARVITKGNLFGGHAIAVMGFIDGKILLLKNYRHATRQWHLEIPRGYGEPGLSGEELASKELLEEAGAVVTEIIGVGTLFPNTGLEELAAELYFARLAQIGHPETEEGISDLILVSVSELEHMITDSTIADSFTIAVYTRAKLRGLFELP